jgi:glutamate formiminotransferase
VLVECVVNLSEGRDAACLERLDAAAGPLLLDRHSDQDHHRSVYTLVGEGEEIAVATRSLAALAVELLDLRAHAGAHPRLGVIDVVPFVPYVLGDDPPRHPGSVVPLRDEFARWLGTELGVPSFLYGPLPGGGLRTLPEVRRSAFGEIAADFGPSQPHLSAGACAVGARTVLVAYNVWVSSREVAKAVATLIRGPAVRALGLEVGDRAQVSCNLIDPSALGPLELYDEVAAKVVDAGATVLGGELVGLLPTTVLDAIPRRRWDELGLSAESSIESRLAAPRAATGTGLA